jgi:SAM-dependent methyltransferase
MGKCTFDEYLAPLLLMGVCRRLQSSNSDRRFDTQYHGRIMMRMRMLWLRTLSERRRKAEVMDQPGLSAAEHHHALRSLARINWFSRSSELLAKPIEALARDSHPHPVRVLDLACGAGDVVVSLARRFSARGFQIEWAGCDLSPLAVTHSREYAEQAGVEIAFFELDVLSEPIPANFDVVMCSLFLHHLTDNDAVSLLTKMGHAATRLVLVNDLVRSKIGFLLAHMACRLLTHSRVVRNDGPLSVENAFMVNEVQRLANDAGLRNATVSRHWPSRMLLQWNKQ